MEENFKPKKVTFGPRVQDETQFNLEFTVPLYDRLQKAHAEAIRRFGENPRITNMIMSLSGASDKERQREIKRPISNLLNWIRTYQGIRLEDDDHGKRNSVAEMNEIEFLIEEEKRGRLVEIRKFRFTDKELDAHMVFIENCIDELWEKILTLEIQCEEAKDERIRLLETRIEKKRAERTWTSDESYCWTPPDSQYMIEAHAYYAVAQHREKERKEILEEIDQLEILKIDLNHKSWEMAGWKFW